MNIKYKYFFLQLKFHAIRYPAVVAVSIGVVLAVFLCGFSVICDFTEGNYGKINVGVVGDSESPYLKIGVNALKTIDTSRFAVNFEEMSEKEANDKLSKNELNGYIFVPDSIIKNEVFAKEGAITYYMPRGYPNFGTVITAEIAESASDIVSESRASISAMRELALRYHSGSSLKEKTDALDMKYVDTALGRSKLFDVRILGVADGIGYAGYWFCAYLMLSVMLWGISASSVLDRSGKSSECMLKIRGVSGSCQIMCEYGAYFIFTFAAFVLFVFGLMKFFENSNFAGELTDILCNGFSDLIFALFVVSVMVCAFHIAAYEITGNSVGAILFIFVLTLGGGYVSGFFYPVSFFADTIRNVGNILPTGVGFSFMRKAVSGESLSGSFAGCLLYSVLFLGLASAARKHKMEVGDI